jgi:hypothetical protein
MNRINIFRWSGWTGRPIALCLLALLLLPGALRAEEQATAVGKPRIEAIQPGEVLTYDVSWSNFLKAGTVVMEIKEGTVEDKRVLRFITTTHTVGLVDKVYRVNDSLESVYDPVTLQSLKLILKESHGKKTRSRELDFDLENKLVITTLNNDPPEILPITDHIQDALSSIYYLRTRNEFIVGKPIIMHVHDGGENWNVEAQTLGRETVKTPAGEFATIKVRTFPQYEGDFKNKGEIIFWLSDDTRRAPVVIKSTISVGAIVLTLEKMEQAADIK